MRLTETYTEPQIEIEIDESDDGAHSYTVTSGEIGGREHHNTTFTCSGCENESELTPGPWGSWICWECKNVVYVGGESR